MPINLFWKTGQSIRALEEKPFTSEAEFEKYVFDNQDLLGGDVTIIYRQIRTSSKQGIPDMIGVDQDSRVCILELKNVEADESILPQALGYAIWAETNPDSIKAIWLESKNRPEDINLDYDNLQIRIILLAPSFKPAISRTIGKIGYDIDLIQVARFGHNHEEFILVDVLEKAPEIRAKTTKVLADWDWDYYRQEHGNDATDQFQATTNAIEAFAKQQGWNMEIGLKKFYAGFKLGNRVVFGVNWGGTHAWNVQLKVPQQAVEDFKGEGWEFQRYDTSFKQAVMRSKTPAKPDIEGLKPLLIEAYNLASGRK